MRVLLVSPGRVEETTLEELASRGRVADCDCGLISCACEEARTHEPECRFRKALTSAVGIECEHGYDTCPECDPCTCAGSACAASNSNK